MRWTGKAADRLRRGLRRLPGSTPSAVVDVIVTVADEQRELVEACLRSIDSQTYDAVETHVVRYGRDEAFKTIGEARNAALDRAEGECVLFLEASETLANGAIASMVERLESTGSDLAVGGLDREGDLPGVRHPDRSRTTVAATPELVTDSAWGNKLFRRGFWDSVTPSLPAAPLAGLGAVVTRALVTASAIDLLPGSVCEAADPGAGLPFGQVLTVMDGVEHWLASLAETDQLLRAPDLAPVRRTWLAAFLKTEAISYVDAVESATDEQWQALCEALGPLIDEGAEHRAGLPWESRTKLWFVKQRRRDWLEEFLHRRRWEGPGHPTEVRGGRVYATVWPHGDASVPLPEDRLELTEDETPLVASLRMVRFVDAETLALDVFAYATLVDDGGERPELTAVLVSDAGDRVSLDVEHRPDLEVTRFARERFQGHDQGGFTLIARADSLLGATRWRVEISLAYKGITRSGTINHRELNGVVGKRPRRLAHGRLWGPSPLGRDGVVIEVAEPAVVLADAEVEGRTVRGRLEGPRAGEVVEVQVSTLRRAQGTASSTTGAGSTSGGGSTSNGFEVPLPDIGFGNRDGEDPEWQVRAATADGTELPIAFPAAPADGWISDDVGEVAWRRSRDGHAAVHEVAHRAVVTGVELDGEEIVVHLRWLGRPPTDWSLALVNVRVTLPGTIAAQEGRTATVRIPTTCDEWGLGTTTAPSGIYRFALTTPDGMTEVVGTDEELVTRTPVNLLGPTLRIRVRQTPRHRLALHLQAPQADDEVGPRAQRLLHEEYLTKQHVLDSNAVYFQAYTGQTATDSARAIHEHLHRHYPHLTLYWGVADLSVDLPEGAVPVVMRTRDWHDVLGRATYLVNNIEFDKWFVKQPGQRFLQTFHGYPAKSMGLVQWRAKRFPERKIQAELDRTMRKWDLILTPSPEMDEHYREQYAYDGPIHNQGYPRDDLLVSPEAEQVRRETRERLGIAPDQKVVLYAPTFRDHLATAHRSAELAEHLDLETASEALGPDYVFLMRGHRFHSSGAQRLGRSRRLIDVTDYPEVNHLILAADAAVLDYSSLRFDFALTRRPMVFLVPDLDVYSGPVRGFLYDYRSTAPGPRLSDAAEVVDALRDLDRLAAEHGPAIETFLDTYQRWQDGHATERVVRAFFGPPPGS
ncbi:MAG: bifunctional glycosyltransferase/CDP-glycerol:glycerophosphate glycerophosphotransferase [Actinomycetota bacterium]